MRSGLRRRRWSDARRSGGCRVVRFPEGATPFARGAFAISLLAILVATLTPSGGAPQPISLCLVCGEGGAGDALSNVILFLPLGAAIALCGWRGRWTVLAPALLSLAVETAQIWLPGRDASLGDLVFNTTGAAVGLAIVLSSAWWLRPGPVGRALLMFGALAVSLGVFFATGVLLQQDLPRSTYWGQWTPQLGHLEWYRGRIAAATLGTLDVPDGQLRNSDSIREQLMARAPLAIRAVAGPALPALGSLLSIADDRSREIMLLGPEREALVLRHAHPGRGGAPGAARPARGRGAPWRGGGHASGVSWYVPTATATASSSTGVPRADSASPWAAAGASSRFPRRLPSWLQHAARRRVARGAARARSGFWLTGRRVGGCWPSSAA